MLTVLPHPGPPFVTLHSASHGFLPPPTTGQRNMTNVAPLHGGINILLGGAMMGGMLVVVFCICYCCHKRVQKTEFPGDEETRSDQWLHASDDSDSTLQVFTLDGQQCYEVEGVFGDDPTPRNSPPPSYHEVVADAKGKEKNDPDLPSYETALRLQGVQRHSAIYMDELTYI